MNMESKENECVKDGGTGQVESKLLPQGFDATNVALKVKEGIGEAEFSEACKTITMLANYSSEVLPYHVGDLINAGERLFPNKYEQWVEFTHYTIGTLRNYAWMCSRVPPENRGIVGIQQTLIAARFKDPKVQRKFMEQSVREGLTGREFLRLVKGDQHYRRKALPESTRRDAKTRQKQLEAAYDRMWDMHRVTWQFMDPVDMGREVWKLAVSTTLEVL